MRGRRRGSKLPSWVDDVVTLGFLMAGGCARACVLCECVFLLRRCRGNFGVTGTCEVLEVLGK